MATESMAAADVSRSVSATTVPTSAVPAAAATPATTFGRYVGCDQERTQGGAGGENSDHSFAFGHGVPPSSVALTFPSAYPGGQRNGWTTSATQTF
jgi:hypothetical protein